MDNFYGKLNDFVVISLNNEKKYLKYLKNILIYSSPQIYIIGDNLININKDSNILDKYYTIMHLEDNINKIPKNIREIYNIGHITYIPSILDKQIYDYIKYNDLNAKMILINIFGKRIIQEIYNLMSEDNNKIEELMKWLGNCPIQVKHKAKNGINYCIASAFFDDILYKENKNYSFKGFKNIDNETLYYLNNILTYKKYNSDDYNYYHVPASNSIEIIGSTGKFSRLKSTYLRSSDLGFIQVYNIDNCKPYENTRFFIIKKKKKKKINIEELVKKYQREPIKKLDSTYIYFKKSLNEITHAAYSELSFNNLKIGEELIKDIYKNLLEQTNLPELGIKYEIFKEHIIYQTISKIIEYIYINNNNDENKTIEEIKTWYKTGYINQNYSQIIKNLTKNINFQEINKFTSEEEIIKLIKEVIKNKKELNETITYSNKMKEYIINNYFIEETNYLSTKKRITS